MKRVSRRVLYCVLLLFFIGEKAFAAEGVIDTTPGTGLKIESDTRVNGAADTVHAEVMCVRPPTITDRVNNCFTITTSSQGVFGSAKKCFYVLLAADVNNALPVYWNYGTASTSTPPLQPGDRLTVYAPVNLDGNGIEVIESACTGCKLCATCQ